MLNRTITGYPFAGLVVDPERAAVQVTLNQLEAAGLRSPHMMAKTPLSRTDKTDVPAKQLRMIVQRTWDKARSLRADLYSEYLHNLVRGKIKGSAPPPAIYTPGVVSETDNGVVLPFRSLLIAVDGDTQLEARFRLRERAPETGDLPFPAIVHFGVEESTAIQILHDYNRFAKPIPESKLGAHNSSGGLSITVLEALDLAGLTDKDLNKSGSAGTAKQVAGFAQAMHFVAGYSLGAKGLKVNAAQYFDALNRPGHPPINGGCTAALAEMFKLAGSIPDDGLRQAFRRMAAPFWQAAGVLAAEGAEMGALDWQAGFDADKALGTTGRGGPRPSRATRQTAIYNALKA